MDKQEIITRRLLNQHLRGNKCNTVKDLVSYLTAIQGQDYPGARWSLALRLAGLNDGKIQEAFDAREIVRTWLMRGTLHITAIEDVKWIQALVSDRILAGSVKRLEKMGLEEKEISLCRDVVGKTLTGGVCLTREALLEKLEQSGVHTGSQRGYQILWHLGQEGLICLGPHQGKQQTFVLLDEWAPESQSLSRAEALVALTRRYFISRGPATLADFGWWSGLKINEIKEALGQLNDCLEQREVNGRIYWFFQGESPAAGGEPAADLLPFFDEYMLAYTDRSLAFDTQFIKRIYPGNNGYLNAPLLINGRVCGIWRREIKKKQVEISLLPFENFSNEDRELITLKAQVYARFLGLELQMMAGKENKEGID